jgi:hypothetical protein
MPHVTFLLVWTHKKDDVSLKMNLISTLMRRSCPASTVFNFTHKQFDFIQIGIHWWACSYSDCIYSQSFYVTSNWFLSITRVQLQPSFTAFRVLPDKCSVLIVDKTSTTFSLLRIQSRITVQILWSPQTKLLSSSKSATHPS